MDENEKSDEAKVRFFMPGEVFLLVDQDREMAPSELQPRLLTILNRLDVPEPLRTALEDREAFQSRSFVTHPPEKPQGCLALVYTFLQFFGLMRRREQLPARDELVSDIPPYFSFVTAGVREADGRLVSDEGLIGRLVQVNESITRYGADDIVREDGVRLRGLIPNWLGAGAQGQLGVGGPGARPTPHTGAATAAERHFNLKHTRFSNSGKDEVTVVILDTMPDQDQLQRAFNKFVTQKPPAEKHTLLAELLSSASAQAATPVMGLGTKLQLVSPYAKDKQPPVMGCHSKDVPQHAEDYGILHHDTYPMVDHGLFVAGIVHSIAPEARLRIIQALNCYGVGSLTTLADAILKLLSDWPGNNVVVNCSLTIILPDPVYSDGRPQMQEIPTRQWLEDTLQAHRDLVSVTEQAIHWLFGLLKVRGAAIVAAAGNEGTAQTHPPARMPAADRVVLGVGAVNEALKMTTYSNRGDTPLSVGLMTFGGGQRADGTAADAGGGPDKGILGIYTQPFPDPQNPTGEIPNATGWGYWAGTSFAAPVVSGALAVLMGQGDTPDEAIAFLRSLLKTGESGEDIFPVTQG